MTIFTIKKAQLEYFDTFQIILQLTPKEYYKTRKQLIIVC